MATTQTRSVRSAVRRSDRAVDDDAWIAALLERAPMAVMATVRDGEPFVNSNIFVYDADEHAIFMHTARTGRTPANVAACEQVCISISEMGRLLPADRAFNLSVEYAGVVVFGRAMLLSDEIAKRRALELLASKYFPHLAQAADYAAPSEDELSRTAVYRIDIDEWSGKRKVGEPDHPGAFLYSDAAAPDPSSLPT